MRRNRAIGGRLGQRGIDKESELSESCHACMPASSIERLEGVVLVVDLKQARKHTPDTLPVTAKLANRHRSFEA